jgi:hypothetical protein
VVIGDYVQGVYIINSRFIGNDMGIQWPGAGGHSDILLLVDNCHFNSGTRAIYAASGGSYQIMNTLALHFTIASQQPDWAAYEINLADFAMLIANNVQGQPGVSFAESAFQVYNSTRCSVIGNISQTRNKAIDLINSTQCIVTNNIGTVTTGDPLITDSNGGGANQKWANQRNGVADVTLDTVAGTMLLNGTQVVGPRIAGWGTPTGNARTASFNGASATLPQTSAVVAQIITDLKTHGLLGA